MALTNAHPKPETTRREEKQTKRTTAQANERICYALVNKREHWRCRVCKKACSPEAVSMLDKGHHHHLLFRSLGGESESNGVILICARCHEAVHVTRLIRLSGDADETLGVKLERAKEEGWKVDRWV